MSGAVSDAAEELSPLPRAGASPRVVREALRPEYREAFDQAFRASLDAAGQELDLQGVHATIEYWRRRAWIMRDADEHRRIVREAVQELSGEAPPEHELTVVSEGRL